MCLLLFAACLILSAQAANIGSVEDPHAHYPYHGYEGVYSQALTEEYPSMPYRALIVRLIEHVTAKALMDHDFQRVEALASNPTQLFLLAMQDHDAVEKEAPGIAEYVQNYSNVLEKKIGKANDVVDDPKNYFHIIAPKLFMAQKALQVDEQLRDSLKKEGLPEDVFEKFYMMVLENPERLYVEDGKREIEQELHLQPGTVQKLKQYYYADTNIYNIFFGYMDSYVVSRLQKYAEFIQNILAEYKVTYQDVLHEYRKILENPQMLHYNGSVSLGLSASAKALEEIVKEIQREYSRVAIEEKTQQ